MNQTPLLLPHLQRLAESVSSLDDEALFALRLTLESLTPSEGAPPPRSPGVWEIDRDAAGVVHWRVRPRLTLRERFSWRTVPLSSERPSGVVRLVLVGSSAAASFGYWEDFSIARAIERKLNVAAGEPRFEVIDLASINGLWEGATATLEHAATLRPDMAIFYCGNNEAKSLLGRLSAGKLAPLSSATAAAFPEALAPEERAAAMHACLGELFDHLVTKSVGVARSIDVETVFVIPEFNLADWQGPERIPLDLGGDRLDRWWRAVTEGESLLAAGCGAEALARFEEAARIDAGGCQRSLFGRARALALSGASPEDLREAYVAARDAGMGPFLRGVPQVTEGVVDTLRRRFGEMGVPFVDLPRLLADARGGGPADRSLFLDYCHLSAEGIDRLAAEVSRIVLERMVARDRVRSPDFSALSAPLRPAAREEGLASWIAAIHNYHYGQDLEVVRHWLSRSLALFPPIEALCRLLSEHLDTPWRERFTLEWFRREGILDLLGERHFFFFAKFFYHARFDHALSALVDDLLGSGEPALQARQTAGSLRDLGGRLYSLFFMDMRRGFVTSDRTAPRGGWERPCLDIDASEPVSIVDFPADGPEAAELVLAVSAPPGGGGGCRVLLNGGAVLDLEVTPERTEHRATIPAGILTNGNNQLRFEWSRLTSLSDHPTSADRRRHVERHGHYPVAARVHELRLDLTDRPPAAPQGGH